MDNRHELPLNNPTEYIGNTPRQAHLSPTVPLIDSGQLIRLALTWTKARLEKAQEQIVKGKPDKTAEELDKFMETVDKASRHFFEIFPIKGILRKQPDIELSPW